MPLHCLRFRFREVVSETDFVDSNTTVVLIGKALVAQGSFPTVESLKDGDLFSLDSLIEAGTKGPGATVDLMPMRPTEDDLALIMYTSGSVSTHKQSRVKSHPIPGTFFSPDCGCVC